MGSTLRDWLGSFWKILIYPAGSTFIEESKKAKGKASSALGWLIFITFFIHMYFYFVFQEISPAHIIILSFLLIPFSGFFLAFSLNTIYRRVFRQEKSFYDEFLYIGVSVFFLYQIIASLLDLIPAIRQSPFSWGLYLYPMFLLIAAVKSLTKLNFLQSLLIVVLSTSLTIAGLLCMPTFLLSLMGSVSRTF